MIKALSKPWPWNTIPEPTPADWGIGMTVCIAAHSFGEGIVLCADSMVSTGDMSLETAIKSRAIGQHWMAMFAGNDVSVVDPIIRDVKKNLQGDSAQDVTSAFVKAMQFQLVSRAENEVLLPLGYTLAEFKSAGLQQLGENFSRLLFEIQQLRLDVQFLICGYDGGDAEIVTVAPPGRVSDYSNIGFWAIGSGQTNALGSLFSLTIPVKYSSLENCIYRVCEAKFNAESAVGVGKSTNLGVLYEDGKRIRLSRDAIKELRDVWEKTRTKHTPAEGRKIIEDAMNEAAEENKPAEVANNDNSTKPPSTPETSGGQP